MPSLRVQILAEDWAKIQPYIRDDSFNQVVVPSQIDPAWGNVLAMEDASTIDWTNRQYYLKILYTLMMLFPESYPTSSL